MLSGTPIVKDFTSVHYIFTSNRVCHFFVFHSFNKNKFERNKTYCTAEKMVKVVAGIKLIVCAANAHDALT